MSDWVINLDEDLTKVTSSRAKEIAKMVITNMVVVVRNQCMSPAEQIEFVSRIGNFQKTHGNDRGKDIIIPEADGILRVTGKKNENGNEGLFGHVHDLDWHSNQTSNPNRMPLIWLYGVEGTKGSRTSWINMIEAYKDLDDEFKEEINNIKVYCGYKKGSYSDSPYFKEHVNRGYAVNLVYTNDAGLTGLFFPFLQIFEFVGKDNVKFDRIMKKLKTHVTQEKYIYHHNWRDGDVVISEQWLSIHKRWRFEQMKSRVLHRIAFDYKFLEDGKGIF